MFQRAFIDLYVGGEFSGVFEASTVQVDTLLGTNRICFSWVSTSLAGGCKDFWIFHPYLQK